MPRLTRLLLLPSLLLTLLFLAAGCVPAAIVEAGHPLTQAVQAGLKSGKSRFDHSQFTAILMRHVDDQSRVDYAALKADHVKLKDYLSRLAKADLTSLGRDELMALLINTYNAYTLDLIVRNYPLESIKKLTSPWDRNICELAGQKVSLNFIEHKLLRVPELFGDPRVHFAVNCASIGCPLLRRRAFTGAKLESQLESAARTTLQDPRYLRVQGGRVHISRILKWFGEDFIKKYGSMSRFLLKYAEGDAKKLLSSRGDQVIEYLDYDWNLNEKTDAEAGK